MDIIGSTTPSEVGLRLLLCPLHSNVVVRTACCSVGIIFPVYSTFKAIERKDQNEQEKWLLYWAVYGAFNLVELFTDKILSWVPLYYHMKFAFLVWLQIPSFEGAKHLYTRYFRPFLLKHQVTFDQILSVANGYMVKFISSHQGEIQFAKHVAMKLARTADQVLRSPRYPNTDSEDARVLPALPQMEDSE